MAAGIRTLTLAFQTLYAELLEQCALDAFNEAFPEAGTFVSKEVRGKRYWYFQRPASEGQRQKYVGPETPELLEHIAQHRHARAAERTRRSLVSTLVRSAGLPRAVPEIGKIVGALAKAGVFRLRGVLVGTMAYQTYPAMLGAHLPSASMMTGDVDIAQFANLSLAVSDATGPMLDVLQATDASFRAVPHLHKKRSVTYMAANGVRVDFLTPNEGRDNAEPKRLPALGTDAEPLRFLDFLIHAPEPGIVLHEAGLYVLVPAPERYAVHKLIVAQRRVGAGNSKRHKDLLQSEALLRRLVEVKSNELRDVWQEAENRGSAWSGYMFAGLGEIDPVVRDRALAVVERTRASIPGLDLKFEGTAARGDTDRDAIVLWANAGKQRIQCIVGSALREDLEADRPAIEALLREKYLHDAVEELGAVALQPHEVGDLRTRAAARKARRTRSN